MIQRRGHDLAGLTVTQGHSLSLILARIAIATSQNFLNLKFILGGLPGWSDDLLHPLAGVGESIEVVSRCRKHQTEDDVPVPPRQIIERREENLHPKAGDQKKDDDHGQTSPAGFDDPRHGASDNAGQIQKEPGKGFERHAKKLEKLVSKDPVKVTCAIFLWRMEKTGCRRRNQGQGNDHGEPDRDHDRERNITEELSGRFLDQKDGSKDDQGCHGGSHDCPRDFFGTIVSRLLGLLSKLEVTVNILNDHDGIINDHPDREGETSQRDNIDRASEGDEHHQRSNHRDRNSKRNDANGTEGSQEEEKSQRCQNSADEDVGAHQIDGVLHISRGIIGLHQLEGSVHAQIACFLFEQSARRVQVADFLPERLHALKKVGSALKLEVKEGHLNSPRPHPGGWFFISWFHLGDVSQINNASFITTNDHFLDSPGRLESTGRPDPDVALSISELSAREVCIGGVDGIAERSVSDPSLSHRGGVYDDMKFGLHRTPNAHLRDPIDPFETRTNATLHEIVQGLGREVRIAGSQPDPCDVIDRINIDRLHLRLQDAFRITRNFIKLLKNIRGGGFNIGPGFKLEPH